MLHMRVSLLFWSDTCSLLVVPRFQLAFNEWMVLHADGSIYDLRDDLQLFHLLYDDDMPYNRACRSFLDQWMSLYKPWNHQLMTCTYWTHSPLMLLPQHAISLQEKHINV